MTSRRDQNIDQFLERVRGRSPQQPDFLQAVEEVVRSVYELVQSTPKYRDASILDRIVEPDRVISFRVAWTDDDENVHVNRGYRVQFNNAIGPYKGGLRFHPSVSIGVLKFLGFEQVFKNALTGLPLGGGKGGSDFDPKGRSDRDVMRFCQAFMTELGRHIGENRDVPAGDIGVGGREIGYLFGQYRRMTAEFTGVLTGKGRGWGGSLLRPEATGYGCVYFVRHALEHLSDGVKGKAFAVSGSGNVALYAAEKILELGGTVVSLSDSGGTVRFDKGLTSDQLQEAMTLKFEKRGRISELAEKHKLEYRDGERPWSIPCDVALPCATQNELELEGAKSLIKNRVKVIAEGANMPTTAEAVHAMQEAGVAVCPGKAANAGGVSVSGLEMSQNSVRVPWTAEQVDERLQAIMQNIHENCVEHGSSGDGVDYVKGANIAGFIRVADAVVDQGVL